MWCLCFVEYLPLNKEEIEQKGGEGRKKLVLGQGIKILSQMAAAVINVFTFLLKSLVEDQGS